MSPSRIPPHYVTRLDAKETVGKSPKTIYRTIRLAIEAGDEKAKALLPHCSLQLKDGEVIEGTAVKSMQQIDQFRRAGRYPTWWLDPTAFSAYFSPRTGEQAVSASDSDDGAKTASKTSSGDNETIRQIMQARLDDKDDQIRELRDDKQFYREHVDTLGEHLERITGLLSHAQLQALGLPKGYRHTTPELEDGKNRDPAVKEATVIDVLDDSPEPSKENVEEGTPKKKTNAGNRQHKRGEQKKAGAVTKKRKTATKKKSANKKSSSVKAKVKKVKKVKKSTWADKHIPNVKRLFSRP